MQNNHNYPHLPQEVVLAHHVPVPDLHSDGRLLTQLLWIQLQLQGLSPVREPGLLDNLKPSRSQCEHVQYVYSRMK